MLSNAALHWVDDHPALFERMTAGWRPAGKSRVQMPANDDHRFAADRARARGREPFAAELAGASRVTPVLALEEYALLLARLGYREAARPRTDLPAPLVRSPTSLFEWVKGTVLTWYAARLEPSLYRPLRRKLPRALAASA